MQMIDVLKRLQELDAKNPNIIPAQSEVKESSGEPSIDQMSRAELLDYLNMSAEKANGMDTEELRDLAREKTSDLAEGKESLAECGMMGSPSTDPHSPATINVTADSGTELTTMLKDLLGLAGLRQVQPSDLGAEPAPATMSNPPAVSIVSRDSDADPMRDLLQKMKADEMNDPAEEGVLGTMAGAGIGAALGGPLGAAAGGAIGHELTSDDEQQEEWDNTPSGIRDIPSKDADAMINKGRHNQDPAGHPGGADGRELRNHPHAHPTEASMFESLMAEYEDYKKNI